MKSMLIRVVAALGIAAAALSAVPAPIAGAAGPSISVPKALINDHHVTAGEQVIFVAKIDEPRVNQAGLPTNNVRVIANPIFTVTGFKNPPGWKGSVGANGKDIVWAPAPNTTTRIAPGTSQGFTFTAETARPAADIKDAAWQVQTSSNGGVTGNDALPISAGALTTWVHTLGISSFSAVDPAQVAGSDPLVVTAGQSPVQLDLRVFNAASGPQSVTMKLDTLGGPVVASPKQTMLVPPGETVVSFDLAFGNRVKTGQIAAKVDASPSTAYRAINYSIEAALDVTAATLQSPLKVAAGVTYPEVATVVDVAGTVPVTFAPGAITIDFPGVGSAVNASDVTIDPTTAETVSLTFTDFAVDLDAADGDYLGTISLEGVDAHGEDFDEELSLGSIKVDNTLPVVLPTISAPAPAAGTEPATTNGGRVTFGGTVSDSAGPCVSCVVTAARLLQLDEGGQSVGAAVDVTTAVTNTAGVLGGGFIVPLWLPGVTSTRLVVDVLDVTLRSGNGTSPTLAVDNIAPVITSASTNGENLRQIDVALSEPVVVAIAGAPRPIVPGEFTCGGTATVLAAALAEGGESVILTLGREVARDETPTCSYEASGTRATDRVQLPLADTTFAVDDGVAPLAPTVEAVDGRLAVDDVFWTNQSTPVLSLSDLDPDTVIDVVIDEDEDGVADAEEPNVGTATATGPTLDLTLNAFATEDVTRPLLVLGTDAAGNVGEATLVPLTFDFTAPELVGSTVTWTEGSTAVAVAFEEVLVGPGRAFDWKVSDGSADYGIGTATLSESVMSLTIDDARFGAATVLHGVTYRVTSGDGTGRLTDLAGNVLADSSTTF